jgi:hypothetical protein
MAKPKPPAVKVIRMPDKFPEQPWKKKKIEGDATATKTN